MTYADIIGGTVRRLVYGAGNRPPVASFTMTSNPTTRTVSFSAADSYDLDGDELSFDWDFGDGAGAQGATPTHTYSKDDPVQVTLTVTDQLGSWDEHTAPVHPAAPRRNSRAMPDRRATGPAGRSSIARGRPRCPRAPGPSKSASTCGSAHPWQTAAPRP